MVDICSVTQYDLYTHLSFPEQFEWDIWKHRSDPPPHRHNRRMPPTWEKQRSQPTRFVDRSFPSLFLSSDRRPFHFFFVRSVFHARRSEWASFSFRNITLAGRSWRNPEREAYGVHHAVEVEREHDTGMGLLQLSSSSLLLSFSMNDSLFSCADESSDFPNDVFFTLYLVLCGASKMYDGWRIAVIPIEVAQDRVIGNPVLPLCHARHCVSDLRSTSRSQGTYYY